MVTSENANAPTSILADQPARPEAPHSEMAQPHPSTEQVAALTAVYGLLRAIGRRHLTDESEPPRRAA
jgi:hypothetical protein